MSSISSAFWRINPGGAGVSLRRPKGVPGTLVLYESPHRIQKLLAELAEVCPDRKVVLARELTKKFEEFNSGSAAELLLGMEQRPPRGEYVVLVSRAGPPASTPAGQ